MTNRTPAYDPRRTALAIVDLQPDFMPGGALPVEEGDELVAPIRALTRSLEVALMVATQDWHPPDHASFASNQAGHQPGDVIQLHGKDQILWPDHCIQGTAGSELHPDMDWRPISAIIRKGTDPASDSYSGFRNNWNAAGERPSTGLEGYLRERAVDTVLICGLTRDFCVKWSAVDAAAAGFRSLVLWDLTRAVDPGADEAVRREMEEAGVEIVQSLELRAF